MEKLSIAVCSHIARRAEAQELSEILGAVLVEDDGSLGSNENHRRAWLAALAGGDSAGWVGVVEDDAIPTKSVLEQLESILSHSPTGVVSGYLGTGKPVHEQPKIQSVLEGSVPSWLISDSLLHHVAVFVRAELVPSLVRYLEGSSLACDDALSVWARGMRLPVAYPLPSPFDHRDEPTVITDLPESDVERRAWLFGSWSPSAGVALLDERTRNYYGGLFDGRTQGA